MSPPERSGRAKEIFSSFIGGNMIFQKELGVDGDISTSIKTPIPKSKLKYHCSPPKAKKPETRRVKAQLSNVSVQPPGGFTHSRFFLNYSTFC